MSAVTEIVQSGSKQLPPGGVVTGTIFIVPAASPGGKSWSTITEAAGSATERTVNGPASSDANIANRVIEFGDASAGAARAANGEPADVGDSQIGALIAGHLGFGDMDLHDIDARNRLISPCRSMLAAV